MPSPRPLARQKSACEAAINVLTTQNQRVNVFEINDVNALDTVIKIWQVIRRRTVHSHQNYKFFSRPLFDGQWLGSGFPCINFNRFLKICNPNFYS